PAAAAGVLFQQRSLTELKLTMGFSYAPAVQTRTGVERATLAKRTYGLVFLSILVTMAGAAFTFTQEGLLASVAQHPFIGILNVFIGSAAGGLWIAAIGVMIMSGLLVFDTWRIMRSGTYGQDDYVLATVSIYLDLLNMFLFIVRLLGGGNRR